MKSSIKLLLSTAVLAAGSNAAFGEAAISGVLSETSPTFSVPEPFAPPADCKIPMQTRVSYATHLISHTGGTLEIILAADGEATNGKPLDLILGLQNGALESDAPCDNAIAYADIGGNTGLDAGITLQLPPGNYTAVATTFNDFEYGKYILSYRSIATVEPTPVPVASIPALALGSLGLIGAAGFVSSRRKAKPKKA